MLYFRLFCKKISKPCGQFLRVWTKNTIVWEILRNFWKFLMKIQWKNWIFLYFLGKFVAKNRNFGNNITFLQQFFSGSGGFKPPKTPPPAYATGLAWIAPLKVLEVDKNEKALGKCEHKKKRPLTTFHANFFDFPIFEPLFYSSRLRGDSVKIFSFQMTRLVLAAEPTVCKMI